MQMAVRIDTGEVFTKPQLCGIHSDLGDIEMFFSEFASGPIPNDQAHGLQHLAPSEPPLDSACHQQGLITVVVEDGAKPFQILPGKGHRNLLHNGIADGIRVTQPLPLHNLHVHLSGSKTLAFLDENFVHYPQTSMEVLFLVLAGPPPACSPAIFLISWGHINGFRSRKRLPTSESSRWIPSCRVISRASWNSSAVMGRAISG